jgi:hypothetical protein
VGISCIPCCIYTWWFHTTESLSCAWTHANQFPISIFPGCHNHLGGWPKQQVRITGFQHIAFYRDKPVLVVVQHVLGAVQRLLGAVQRLLGAVQRLLGAVQRLLGAVQSCHHNSQFSDC